MERESAAIRENPPKKIKRTIPDGEEDNDAAPAPKAKRRKTVGVYSFFLGCHSLYFGRLRPPIKKTPNPLSRLKIKRRRNRINL